MAGLQTLLATPVGNFLGVFLIGILVGWFYKTLGKSTHRYITCILVGLAGSQLGFSLTSFAIAGSGAVPMHVTPLRLCGAAVGAVVVLLIWRTQRRWTLGPG
jgi:uncharacterized membrane protein YeaQ/YmgE (transglycosylase-associated protein family)